MRTPTAAVYSALWFVLVGGTFGCLLPYVLHEWHIHRPLPYWAVAQATGVILIGAGLVPLIQSFVEFLKAGGTPIPVASPPHLVVSGFYRYVRNPIYAAFMVVLLGEVLLFGALGLLEYSAVAWCIGAAAVRWYEEPTLAHKFGAEYQTYRRAVRAWLPRWHPRMRAEQTAAADGEVGSADSKQPPARGVSWPESGPPASANRTSGRYGRPSR